MYACGGRKHSSYTRLRHAYSLLATLAHFVTVLVADDLRLNRILIKRKLNQLLLPELTVTEAQTGEEALSLLTEGTFDLALLDEHMTPGGLKGTDVSRRVRQIEMMGDGGSNDDGEGRSNTPRSRVPMVLIGCTGNADMDEYISEARQCGMDTTIGKPLPPNFDEMVTTLMLQLCDRKMRASGSDSKEQED